MERVMLGINLRVRLPTKEIRQAIQSDKCGPEENIYLGTVSYVNVSYTAANISFINKTAHHYF